MSATPVRPRRALHLLSQVPAGRAPDLHLRPAWPAHHCHTRPLQASSPQRAESLRLQQRNWSQSEDKVTTLD